MLRQDTLQNPDPSGAKKQAVPLQDNSSFASLREAYFLAAGDSGRVISGSVLNEIRSATPVDPTKSGSLIDKLNSAISPAQQQSLASDKSSFSGLLESLEPQNEQVNRSVQVPRFLMALEETQPVKASKKTPQALQKPVMPAWDKRANAPGSLNATANTPKALETTSDQLAKLGITPQDPAASDWASQFHQYDSVWVKLFERPRLLLSIIGFGLISCSVYIVLGYWWVGATPASQAAEPVTMLNVKSETPAGDQNPTQQFNNIHSIQQNSATGGSNRLPAFSPATEKQGSMLLAQALPITTPFSHNSLSGALAGQGHSSSRQLGRPDPFLPLVVDKKSSDGATGDANGDEENKDPFADVLYTGFIGDINAKDKVALIRVHDPLTGAAKTQIKKIGEFVSINGQNVRVKAISKTRLQLSTNGVLRELAIQPYQTGSSQSPGAASSASTALGGENVNLGNILNTNALGNINPAQPVLSEPKGY